MFHYVWAAMSALISLIPVIHVGMGIAMLTGYWPMPPASVPGAQPFAYMGWLFVGIGATVIVFGETLAILTFFAGRAIKARQSHLFCLIVAGINCLNMPLGTILGAFTFVVLLRPTVKAMFVVNDSG